MLPDTDIERVKRWSGEHKTDQPPTVVEVVCVELDIDPRYSPSSSVDCPVSTRVNKLPGNDAEPTGFRCPMELRRMGGPQPGTPDGRPRLGSELVNGEAVVGHHLGGLGGDLAVVGEQKHLGGVSQVVEYAEAGLRTLVVEVDEQIVEHEGEGTPAGHELFESRDAQGQVELVPRARAEGAEESTTELRDRLLESTA